VSRRAGLVVAIGVMLGAGVPGAHSGPPFPIVSNQTVGPYLVSVWADPDSTDDGSAGGRFWVTFAPRDVASPPPETRVTVTVTPSDGASAARTALAAPLTDSSHRFAAVVMDREGRFRVRVDVDGPLGQAHVEADVEATYDLRPPAAMIVLYLVPFLLVGFLWVKLLLRRRSPKCRVPNHG
jgi:hypothetical protein